MRATIKKKIYYYSAIVLAFIWPAMRIKLMKPKLVNKLSLENEGRSNRRYYDKSLILVTCLSMGYLLTKLPNGTLWDMLIPVLLAAMLV
jgi:hypothetical protein